MTREELQRWPPELRKLVHDTVASDATEAELDQFEYICLKTGLDPIARQIHFTKRGRDEDAGGKKVVIQTGIDGFRLVAQRTGEYEGQTEPQWCDSRGVWHNVWVHDTPPSAARVGVFRRGFRDALLAVAHYREYVQTTWANRQKVPNRMWKSMPSGQLLKCAEALAIRKAFPQELSGLYTTDEMGQANNSDEDPGDRRDSREASRRERNERPARQRTTRPAPTREDGSLDREKVEADARAAREHAEQKAREREEENERNKLQQEATVLMHARKTVIPKLKELPELEGVKLTGVSLDVLPDLLAAFERRKGEGAQNWALAVRLEMREREHEAAGPSSASGADGTPPDATGNGAPAESTVTEGSAGDDAPVDDGGSMHPPAAQGTFDMGGTHA